MKKQLALLALLILSGNIRTVQAEEYPGCNINTLINSGHIHLAAIKSAKLHYIKDNATPGCPSTQKKCQRKEYLSANQRVLIGNTYKQWVCALYSKSGSQTVGWLHKKSLQIENKTQTPAYKQWLGWWRTTDQLYSIEIFPEPIGQLKIIGNGVSIHYYEDSEGVKHPEPYFRDFGGQAKPNGNVLRYNPEHPNHNGAYLEIHLLGQYIIVDDQLDLGGRVYFSDIYQKYTRKNKPLKRPPN